MYKVMEFSRSKGSESEGASPIFLSQESLKTLGEHGTPKVHGMGFESVPLDSQIGYLNQ